MDQRDVEEPWPGIEVLCMGPCSQYYPREELKVSEGRVFCASCLPATVPGQDVTAPHKRGQSSGWRKK